MSTLEAFRIHRDAEPFAAGLESLSLEALTDGDVVLDVLHSSVNYKDALAGTGRGRILRAPVLNGGIDVAGRVAESESPLWTVGDEAFVCGSGGLSETRDGGYATRVRLPASVLMRPPEGLSLRDTMAVGTAGITAAIALRRLADNGQRRDLGPMLVTGASGGVGSFAVHLLSRRGYAVTASTGKAAAREHLVALGASEVIGRLGQPGSHGSPGGEAPPKPLEAGHWGGAIDSVGGATLARVVAATRPWGSIACVGLAEGVELHTTVMPLILRGVSLLGINCVELPAAMLADCWAALGRELDAATLARIAPHSATLADLPEVFEAMMAGTVTGRTVVDVQSP